MRIQRSSTTPCTPRQHPSISLWCSLIILVSRTAIQPTNGFHSYYSDLRRRRPLESTTTTTTTTTTRAVFRRDDVRPTTTTPVETKPTTSRRRDVLTTAVVVAVGGRSWFARPDLAVAQINTRKGGLPNQILRVCGIMDELQRDVMQEQYDLVATYPAQLRSFVPVFTAYTDFSFPGDDGASSRVELRYEVGRFFSAVERLRKAAARRALKECYVAYSDAAVHFDKYLQLGDLYRYEDTDPIEVTRQDLSKFYEGIGDSSLVYADPRRDPPQVQDLIVVIGGPDKGRTGIVIGVLPDKADNYGENSGGGGGGDRVIKLDKRRNLYRIRDVRVVKQKWVAKRVGEQSPDDVFLLPRKELAKKES